MTKNLAEWKIRNTYTLAEATLLMLGKDPGEWPQSKLIEKTPPKFDLIFGKMIEDAKHHLGYRESEEVEGEYFAEYLLMTDNPEDINTRSRKDFLTTTSDWLSLNRWTKSFVTYLQRKEITIDGLYLNFFVDDFKVETTPEIKIDKLSPYKEQNMATLIDDLASLLPGYDPKRHHVTARIIIDMTGTSLCDDTIAGYLKVANAFRIKKLD